MSSINQNLVLRSVTLPVSRPDGTSWNELMDAIRCAWSMSTNLANWAMLRLVQWDLTRTAGMERLPPMPSDPEPYKRGKNKGKQRPLYLYGLAKREFPDWRLWEGCFDSAQCVLRFVEKRYKDDRLDIVWRGSARPSRFRYPVPFPVHNQSWSATYSEDGQHVPQVELNLPGGKFTLKLRTGGQFSRQLAAFREIVGGAKKGELSLYQKNDHLMCKMVARLPKKNPSDRTHTMNVNTDPAALWVAEVSGTHARVWNCDHVRRWQQEHKTFLQRISEDTKREKRVPRKMRRHIDQYREDRCRKHSDRINAFNHEVTSQLVNLAMRLRVGAICYDDSCRTYLGDYPYYDLSTKLKYKAEERGITFVSRSLEESHVSTSQ